MSNTLDVYVVLSHPAASASAAASSDAWKLFARGDEEAIEKLRAQAKDRLASGAYQAEDLIVMKRPDQSVLGSWNIKTLAK